MRTNKKALAAATATAVALGSLSAPAVAADKAVVEVDGTTTATGTANTDKVQAESGSSLKGMEPKEIKEWLGVITAVLSIVGTLATFAMKYAPQFTQQR